MRLFNLVGWALCEGLYVVCEKFVDRVEISERITPEKVLLKLKKEVVEC